MALEHKLVDKRTIRRFLEQSKVDAAEYRAWLEALPDRSDRVAPAEGDSQADTASRRG